MNLDGDPAVLDLCKRLHLQFEPQDWGIANACARRLGEFITFYRTSADLSKAQRHHMGELIVASANDGLRHDSLPDKARDEFMTFLRDHGQDFPIVLAYWRSLAGDTDEFPVATLIGRKRTGT